MSELDQGLAPAFPTDCAFPSGKNYFLPLQVVTECWTKVLSFSLSFIYSTNICGTAARSPTSADQTTYKDKMPSLPSSSYSQGEESLAMPRTLPSPCWERSHPGNPGPKVGESPARFSSGAGSLAQDPETIKYLCFKIYKPLSS